jgi:hypothetical protein
MLARPCLGPHRPGLFCRLCFSWHKRTVAYLGTAVAFISNGQPRVFVKDLGVEHSGAATRTHRRNSHATHRSICSNRDTDAAGK